MIVKWPLIGSIIHTVIKLPLNPFLFCIDLHLNIGNNKTKHKNMHNLIDTKFSACSFHYGIEQSAYFVSIHPFLATQCQYLNAHFFYISWHILLGYSLANCLLPIPFIQCFA